MYSYILNKEKVPNIQFTPPINESQLLSCFPFPHLQKLRKENDLRKNVRTV